MFMKAVVYEKMGAARDVLRIVEREKPEPGVGEVRVRVAVSAVNPSDTKRRSRQPGAPAPFPLVTPHQDGAGIIDAVGAGVDRARIGERVWLYMAQYGRPFGTAAEYTCVPSERAVPLHGSASLSDGACLGIPAMTAHLALFRDGPIAGKTILVTGGAGAVGFYAVQLAKWGRARKVIATVSRPEQEQQALMAGADAVVNYKAPDCISQIRAAAGGDAAVDHIVEVAFGANLAQNVAVIATNGIIAGYGSDAVPEPSLPYWALTNKDVMMRSLLVYEAPQTCRDEAARDINAMIEAGLMKHQVARRFALDDIIAAHEAMETGKTVGKILVDVAKLD
jgi:NADPH2:quinone reductase